MAKYLTKKSKKISELADERQRDLYKKMPSGHFLNNQEMQIRNRTSEDDSLPCVREFQETANELTEKAEEEKARYRRNNEKAIAEANRRWDEQRRSMVNDWISEATQAGVSCAHYFEYMYQELGMNRGPAFWLAFRFCGRDGVIASSPRGISQLRTMITIRVAVSEKENGCCIGKSNTSAE